LNIQSISFAGKDTPSIIPAPIERKNRGGWMDWGKDNLYPKYLIELTHRSAIHNAIINLKASMIGRNGFINADWSPETVQFIHNANNAKDDLEEILAKVAIDLTIFGGYALELIWNREKTRIATIAHIPIENIRIAIPEDGVNEQYYVSNDWSDIRKNVPVPYTAFSTIDRKAGSQILYVKEYRAGGSYYPEPEYKAGISLCELNAEINDYHLSTVQNQFAPSIHINVPYEMLNDEEKDIMVKKMREEYQGSKNAGNVLISLSHGSELKPSIETIQMNDSDKRFKELTNWMQQGIFSAHQITDQSLLAFETPGALGKRTELIDSLVIFQAQYVAIKQRFIEKQLSVITRVNGLRDKLQIERYSDNIIPDIPVSDLMAILSSTLPDLQKVSILLTKGYNRTKALELVNSGAGASQENTPIE
jgi:hypothetical protein